MNRSPLTGSIYQHYVYSFPHKTAYRPLAPAIPLRDLWEFEDRGALFLYMHVPFCEFRCGFCNLFTQAIPPHELPDRYLAQLRCEALTVRDQLGDATFARMAIGGGTPTFLNESQLEELFAIAGVLRASPHRSPCGVECSPATLTESKLDLLLDHGVERLSMGVQSFSRKVCRALGRPQDLDETRATLDLLRQSRLRRLNVDLIYGAQDQSPDDFVDSIEELLRWQPDEIFLYPLYIRPLTGLGKKHARTDNHDWDMHRLLCYRAGRDRLLAAGYRQQSMRMFTRAGDTAETGPDYSCQLDGMVGLGCGARSYTAAVHYSTEYAVARSAVHAIIDNYLHRETDHFACAHYGVVLSQEERLRRFVLMSLLQVAGLDLHALRERFAEDAETRLPELRELQRRGLASRDGQFLKLTTAGLERSDQVGPRLFSERVRRRMEEYTCV